MDVVIRAESIYKPFLCIHLPASLGLDNSSVTEPQACWSFYCRNSDARKLLHLSLS